MRLRVKSVWRRYLAIKFRLCLCVGLSRREDDGMVTTGLASELGFGSRVGEICLGGGGATARH
jgi:hypothetical protein